MIENVLSPEDGDPILCEWCKLPIVLHPQDANRCYRCKVYKVKSDMKVIA